MDDWNDYQIFAAVVRNETLSAAARSLGITQPTVSRRLGELEQRVGRALFDRQSTSLSLNGDGQRLWKLMAPFDEMAARVSRDIETFAGDDSQGSLRLSLTEGLASFWLPAVLKDIRKSLPGLSVEIQAGNSLSVLQRGEADIALRTGPRPSPRLVSEKLFSLSYGLYGSRSYLGREGVPEELVDLQNHALISFGRDFADLPEMNPLKTAVDVNRRLIQANSVVTQLALCRQGLGLAVLPLYLANRDPKLRRLPLLPELTGRPFWLTARPETLEKKLMRQVWESFKAAPTPT
ncbi:LysR family transcriptional regulator [Rhodovibrionaceae bacterium A322]